MMGQLHDTTWRNLKIKVTKYTKVVLYKHQKHAKQKNMAYRDPSLMVDCKYK